MVPEADVFTPDHPRTGLRALALPGFLSMEPGLTGNLPSARPSAPLGNLREFGPRSLDGLMVFGQLPNKAG